MNKGRHLCSAGRPSRWALAHIFSLSLDCQVMQSRNDAIVTINHNALYRVPSSSFLGWSSKTGRSAVCMHAVRWWITTDRQETRCSSQVCLIYMYLRYLRRGKSGCHVQSNRSSWLSTTCMIKADIGDLIARRVTLSAYGQRWLLISWPTFTLLSLPLCLECYNRP